MNSMIHCALAFVSSVPFDLIPTSIDDWTKIVAIVLVQATALPLMGTLVVARFPAAYRYAVMLSLLWLMLLSPVAVCACQLTGLRFSIPVFASSPELQSDLIAQTLPFDEPGLDTSQQNVRRAATTATSSPEVDADSDVQRIAVLEATKATSSTPHTANQSWASVLFVVWCVGLVVGVGRLVAGLVWIRGLLRYSKEIDVPAEATAQLKSVFGSHKLPDIREHQNIQVPIMTGIRRPVIVISKGLVARLSNAEWRALIVHEYAHACRGDCLVGGLQRVAEIVYWFHPLVYWLNRRLSIAREEICDNYALQVTNPSVYAGLLLKVSPQSTLPNAAPAMPLISSVWKLEDRIKGVLEPNRVRVTDASRTMKASLLAMIALCFFLPSVRFVAKADEPSEQAVDLYGDPIPSGGKVLMGTQRFRTTYDDHKLAFADDTTLVSLSENGRFTWWDATTGKATKSKHVDVYPRGFAIAPDRSSLAFSYFKAVKNDPTTESGIRIHDPLTGDQVAKILFEDRVGESKLLYTPDARNIICAARQGKMYVIDVLTKDVLLDFKFPTEDEFDCIAISPDGSQVAAATSRKLFLWDWIDGQDPDEVQGDFERLYAMTFSPDAKSLLLARNQFGKRRESIDLLNLETREIKPGFEDPVMERFRINNMIFTRNGRHLIVPNGNYVGDAKDNAILIWDFETKQLLRRLQCDNAQPGMIALSNDEHLLATNSHNEITVFDLQTGGRVAADCVGHNASISGVRFTADGQRLITCGDDQTARVWDAATGKQLGRVEHRHWVRGMSVSHDGRWFATSSLDDAVRLFDVATMKQVYELPGHGTQGGNRALAFTANSSRFASYGDDAYLRVWDVATGKAVLEELIQPAGKEPPRHDYMWFSSSQGVFSNDATRLLVFDRQAAHLYDAVTGKELAEIKSGRPLESACFVPQQQRLFVARPYVDATRTRLDDGRVRSSAPDKFEAVMIDLKDQKELWSFRAGERIGPLGISRDGRLAVFGTQGLQQGTLHLLDASNGALLGKIKDIEKLAWHKNGGNVSFSEDKRMAVALRNGTVIVWDLKQMGIWK